MYRLITVACFVLLAACGQQGAAQPASGERSVDDLLEQIRATATAEEARQQAIQECVEQFLAEVPTWMELVAAKVQTPPGSLGYSQLSVIEACEKDVARQGYSEQTQRILAYLDERNQAANERFHQDLAIQQLRRELEQRPRMDDLYGW